jgi:hypothetical protein
MNEVLTLEKLPKAFMTLTHEVSEIKKLLIAQGAESQPEKDEWFDLIELCNYHPEKPTKATVYGWVHKGKISSHKRGKKLYFLKSQIDFDLRKGRIQTTDEIKAEVDSYSIKRKEVNHDR